MLNAQRVCRGLAFKLPHLVASVCKFPLHAGLDHHDLPIVRERKKLKTAINGIQCQHMPAAPRRHGHLVHDPAGHAHEFVFDAPRRQRERHIVRFASRSACLQRRHNCCRR